MVYKWFSGGRKIKGNDWNALADLVEDGVIEKVDSLPSCIPDNYGKVVYLTTDGRLYICKPP